MGEALGGFLIVDLGVALTLLCLWKLWVVLKEKNAIGLLRDWVAKWVWK